MDLEVQIKYICEAKTIEEVEALRKRITASKKLSEYEKKELLMHCDVHQGKLWWDSLPEKELLVEIKKSSDALQAKKIRGRRPLR